MADVTSPAGELRYDADGQRTLVFHRRYPYPIEDVWAAVTDSDRLVRWFGSYQGVGVVGGTVALTMIAEEDAGGEPSTVHIIECESPRRLVVDVPEHGISSWRIALTLAAEGGATTLLFEQAIPPEMQMTDVGPGWHWYLDRLAASLTDTPMPDWNDYYPALSAVYA
ncbi:MAG: SRPBCC family protein [Pseudonocardiales bacterium]